MADWVCVFESFDMHEALIKKAVLNENYIESVILNKKDSMYQFINEGTAIQLLVKPDFAIRAKHILEKSNE